MVRREPTFSKVHVRIILASGSPRRRELLARVVESFEIIPSACEEPADGPPEERVVRSACVKARDIAQSHRGLVIGADTLVVVGDDVLGKPMDRDEARRMMKRLSGREHRVLTGICILSTWPGEEHVAVEETTVSFRAISDAEIDAYLASGEADDKAGAYGIQGRAALFIDRICGDYYNVMGLPLCRLSLMLRSMGVHV